MGKPWPVTAPNFQMVPGLLLGSDMIALLPSRILPDFEGLVSFLPPVPVPGFLLHLAWHRWRAKDAALQHVAVHETSRTVQQG
ncbi:hypothetical protein [Bosea sp. F3-2]|uniref:hypothetical protein n=1 Tax=Bosea sp. F3-2 TaxID=2599640 RepID=UPI0020BDC4BD|nr:hypothetical protein [Bosea sp. F3-2]